MNPSGIMLALISAALFGASTPIAKLLLGAIDPWLLAGLLYLGSGVGLGIVMAIRHMRADAPTEARLAVSDLPWLAGAVLTGGVLGPVMLMLGLARTEASTAALMLNLEGLATMGIAWLVFRENVNRPSSGRCGSDPGRRRAALMAGRPLRVRPGRIGDRSGVPRLGHRQQPHSQAQCR